MWKKALPFLGIGAIGRDQVAIRHDGPKRRLCLRLNVGLGVATFTLRHRFSRYSCSPHRRRPQMPYLDARIVNVSKDSDEAALARLGAVAVLLWHRIPPDIRSDVLALAPLIAGVAMRQTAKPYWRGSSESTARARGTRIPPSGALRAKLFGEDRGPQSVGLCGPL
jgi:hypothetical protein